jgi:hypothetical protein
MGKLLRVAEVRVGETVTAITGSIGRKNLQERVGKVTGFATKTLETGRHYVSQAEVTLADGEVVRTHRLKNA